MRFSITLILMAMIHFNCRNNINKTSEFGYFRGKDGTMVKLEAPPPPPEDTIEDITYLRDVLLNVDKPALYKKGMEAFFKYAQDSTKNPICVDLEGTVYIGFVVEIDGVLSNIRVKRGIGCGWNEAAMKTLEKTSGDWICGFNGGKAVRSYMVVPIKCKIE